MRAYCCASPYAAVEGGATFLPIVVTGGHLAPTFDYIHLEKLGGEYPVEFTHPHSVETPLFPPFIPAQVREAPR